ncbi:MAG: hypothetical protein H0U15_11545 [Geodermatophilaceae bacterium]|jgi:hypothetical protein|nr:hypothetical protein [Geodermatophilaceae bacterium]
MTIEQSVTVPQAPEEVVQALHLLIDPNTTALYAMLGFLRIAGAVIFWQERTVA